MEACEDLDACDFLPASLALVSFAPEIGEDCIEY